MNDILICSEFLFNMIYSPGQRIPDRDEKQPVPPDPSHAWGALGAGTDRTGARARKNPGSLDYASSDNGTKTHLAGELFKMRGWTDIVPVSYKGSSAAIKNQVVGRIDFGLGKRNRTTHGNTGERHD